MKQTGINMIVAVMIAIGLGWTLQSVTFGQTNAPQPGADRLVVEPFQSAKLDSDILTDLAQLIRQSAAELGDKVFSGAEMEAATKDKKKELPEKCSDPKCAKQLAEIYGAKSILVGSIEKNDTGFMIAGLLVDRATGRVIRPINEPFSGSKSELKRELKNLAKKIATQTHQALLEAATSSIKPNASNQPATHTGAQPGANQPNADTSSSPPKTFPKPTTPSQPDSGAQKPAPASQEQQPPKSEEQPKTDSGKP